MTTEYKNEATQYEENANATQQVNETEETQFEDATAEESAQGENPEAEENAQEETSATEEDTKKAKRANWKSNAAGAAAGVLVGTISTVFMGMKAQGGHNSDGENGNHQGGGTNEDLSHPEWVDDKLPVAVTVNDDMSFGEAFAAARAEVGPGGCFEWRGQIYGTYTAEEWNAMSPEERAEFNDHFSWNHISREQSTETTTTTTTSDDDIEIVSVNHGDNNSTHSAEPEQPAVEVEEPAEEVDVVNVENDDPQIEILGVVHDDESGANLGGMIVDGQEVILIDVDNDQEFDYIAADINGNGEIEQNEISDIQGQGLTTDNFSLLGNTDTNLASNDPCDYSTDVPYEG